MMPTMSFGPQLRLDEPVSGSLTDSELPSRTW